MVLGGRIKSIGLSGLRDERLRCVKPLKGAIWDHAEAMERDYFPRLF